MRDMNTNWCFEGGCTSDDYLETNHEDQWLSAKDEDSYIEPCLARYD